MQEIHDATIIRKYLNHYDFTKYFTQIPEGFFLCQYEKGELLSSIYTPTDYLQFSLDGIIRIYTVNSDGSLIPVGHHTTPTLLGDVELCGNPTYFIVEAASPVTCLVLPLNHCRESLLNDNRFLRLLVNNLSDKLEKLSNFGSNLSTVEERLIHYLQICCPDHTLTNVENATFHLHCSRRQIQRILKKQTETGTLRRIGKGKYVLAEPISD